MDTYDSLDEGEDGDGEVPAEEGVGEEAAEEAEEEGGAHEVGDDVGRRGAGQVHGAREVGDEVHGDAHGGEALAELDPEGQRRRHPAACAGLIRPATPVVHRVLHQVAAAGGGAPRPPLLHLLPVLSKRNHTAIQHCTHASA
jgi:hypothetical protein